MTADAPDPRQPLFPAIEPYAVHRLKVSDLHEIYVEECGNPLGKPVIMIHGGPGAGCTPMMRRCHDPDSYRIILVDQRGCGRSTPYSELRENTTWDLVADMESIRAHLGIVTWQLFGGSWGSTLALAYAETHPERVSELILRGIFMLRRSELLWFYQEGASWLLPEAFEPFRNEIAETERHDLIAAYHRRLTGTDEARQLSAARQWSMWEGGALSLLPDPGRVEAFGDPHYAIAFARIEAHYFVNGGFFDRDDQLLANAHRLRGLPGVIVHGRYDLCTPVANAIDLHKAWPEAELVIVPDGGHAMSEPGILAALVAAAERFKA
ncbi:prolyl aminopeptidase Serine peptidase. MEROPS family S33 [Kaistia soli DSM 19436]|uniref:Proline iminopeptidase n=1 Tax=Kaistia soli DSM 19436 TaxID=1122133 RepID=A0A1M5LE97_9HYPH|nr:prolyl aminopeptidase [Kaistia soli]SHG63270.1 prolyl aminopeptidase Serine peptidase. MEROPS family S33 [Kaistia soli DSM 19436]